ncbi:MAG: T9SS type A sorting domain-containing protein [Ignavibacteria bacterium]
MDATLAENEKVTLVIYNILGMEIATLVNENQSAGTYNVEFDAGNLPSGVYFYKLSACKNVMTKKMLLVK